MVAVKPGDVAALLNGPPPTSSAILVYGPDSGLVSERVAKLIQLVAGPQDDPFRVLSLDGDTIASDPQRLIDEATTVSLFGDKRAIHVRVGTRSIVPALKPVLDGPASDAIIIIQAGDLAKTAPLRTLCERAQWALAIPCYADGPRELSALIDEVLNERGLKLERDARSYLLSLLGADRRTSRNEIEKLALYAKGKETIGVEAIDAVCGDAATIAADALVDATFLGDATRAELEAARLFADGVDPGVLLGMLLRHAFGLAAVCGKVDRGIPATRALEGLRLHFKRKDAVQRQIGIWSENALLALTHDLNQAISRCRKNTTLRHEVSRTAMWAILMRARRARIR